MKLKVPTNTALHAAHMARKAARLASGAVVRLKSDTGAMQRLHTALTTKGGR